MLTWSIFSQSNSISTFFFKLKTFFSVQHNRKLNSVGRDRQNISSLCSSRSKYTKFWSNWSKHKLKLLVAVYFLLVAPVTVIFSLFTPAADTLLTFGHSSYFRFIAPIADTLPRTAKSGNYKFSSCPKITDAQLWLRHSGNAKTRS